MIVLHDCDGNSLPLSDIAAFLQRITDADTNAWQGETGQVGVEYRLQSGSAWLFLSLVADGRYRLHAQRPNGVQIRAVNPDGDPALRHPHLLAGRWVEHSDEELLSAAETVDAVRYFLLQDGLLSPTTHWRKDGEPYWPDFD